MGPGAGRENHACTNQLLKAFRDGNGSTTSSTQTIPTDCPFCMTMMTDELRDHGHENAQLLNVSAFLLRAVRGSAESKEC